MSGQVMVFVPAPELTITVEQAREDPDIHLHAGGQGIWQARMIGTLGVPVVLCTAYGGETGVVLKTLVAEEGLLVRSVQVEARNGAYIHDRRDGDRVEVARAPGGPLTRHDFDELYGLALAEGLRSSVTLLSGTQDPGIVEPDAYRRLAGDLRRNGSAVVADLSGDYLTAILESGLTFLKVSHEELISDGRVADDSLEALQGAIISLHDEGAEAVVVSRAADPALAYIEGEVYEVVLPALEPADHRGAGDSMTAGVTATLAQGGDLRTAIRIGAAAGAVNVTRHGLGTGRASVIAALMDKVELRHLSGVSARTVSPKELAEEARDESTGHQR
jgi:1-phosphofructokinase